MQRITITIDDDLLAAIDRIAGQRGYASRSEAVRDIVRDAVAPGRTAEAEATPCFGALSYVYSHNTRDLARRLTDEGHHHGVSVASLHVHLNRDDCLELAVLRGTVQAMRAHADAVTTQRGVRYGHLQLIPEGSQAARGREPTHGHGEEAGCGSTLDAAPGDVGDGESGPARRG